MRKILFKAFFIVCYVLPAIALSSHDEGFLLDDEKHLVKKGRQWTCDDKAFDKIFPPCTQSTVDQTVGRIVCDDGMLGTGTIIESDGTRVTGITAKHVLFRASQPVFGNFFQGSMRTGPQRVGFLAKIKIDEILLKERSREDIVLFRGKYVSKKDGFHPAIATPVATAPRKGRRCIRIYHYPLGVEDQRRNTGTLDGNEFHCASTLPASSGAPVMNRTGDFIIGIHTGAGRTLKKVTYTGHTIKNLKQNKFDLCRCNRYVSVLEGGLSQFKKSYKPQSKKVSGKGKKSKK